MIITQRRRWSAGFATLAAGAVLVTPLAAPPPPAAAAAPSSLRAAPDAASAAEWEALHTRLDGLAATWTKEDYRGAISRTMPDTALLGNGDVGVTSAGSVGTKTFLISKGDFWTGNPIPTPAGLGGVTIGPVGDEEETGPDDLALGAAMTASTTHHIYSPSRATDGQWSANGYEGWVSAVGEQAWIQADLGEERSISRYVLRHDGAGRPGQEANNPRDFIVQTSVDGSNWTTIDTITGNTASVTDRDVDQLSARYVRIDYTKPTQGGSDPRARLGQLQLFAEPKPDTGVEPTAPFQETQNIAEGTIDTAVTIGGHALTMRTWTAADTNLVVTELTSAADEDATFRLSTWSGAGNARSDYQQAAGVDGQTLWATRSTAPGDNWVSRAGLTTRILGAELASTDSTGSKAQGEFVLSPGASVQIVTAVTGGGQDPALSDVRSAGTSLANAQNADTITRLAADRDAWWRSYWLRSTIDVGDEAIERYYYTALYHLANSSRTGKTAPGIFGIWANVDDLMWFGDMHLNYNFQAPFYGVYSSNRPELADSYVDTILDYVPEAQRRAKEDLHRVNEAYIASRPDLANGIDDAVLYPVGIGPFGSTTAGDYYNQVVDSLFSVSQFVTYWEYTKDQTFLADKAYPLMTKVASFFEQYLEWDADADEYVLHAAHHEGSWSVNPSTDIGLLTYLLTALVDGSEVLDRDAAKRTQWQHILDHLPAPPTTTFDGTTVYSLAKPGTSNDGRDIRPGDNTVNLEFIHPGEVLGIRGSDAARQIAIDTLDVMDSWGQDNSFPKVFTQAARVGYPADALLQRFTDVITTRSAPNQRVTDPYHGIEKAGAIETVNSMLIQTDRGVTVLFPAWPAERDASFDSLRQEGAFVVSAARTGGVVGPVTVVSDAGGTARFANPWTDQTPVVVGADGTRVASEFADGVLSFDTVRGASYRILPSDVAQVPTVDIALSGAAGQSGWFTTAPTVTLSAAAASSESASSESAASKSAASKSAAARADEDAAGTTFEYRVNGGDWMTYAAPVTLPEGVTELTARAIAGTGVAGAPSSVAAKVDTIAPTVRGAVDAQRALSVIATDAGSGVSTVEYSLDAGATWQRYSAAVALDAAAHAIDVRSQDVAGNTASSERIVVADVRSTAERLAQTGATIGGILLVAALLIGAGALFLADRRRRQSTVS